MRCTKVQNLVFSPAEMRREEIIEIEVGKVGRGWGNDKEEMELEELRVRSIKMPSSGPTALYNVMMS
jgi:hypothetical protein